MSTCSGLLPHSLMYLRQRTTKLLALENEMRGIRKLRETQK